MKGAEPGGVEDAGHAHDPPLGKPAHGIGDMTHCVERVGNHDQADTDAPSDWHRECEELEPEVRDGSLLIQMVSCWPNAKPYSSNSHGALCSTTWPMPSSTNRT